MAYLLCFVWALAGQVPQVQVDTLKSGQTAGTLTQISATQVVIGDKPVPLSEVLEIRFPPPEAAPAAIPHPIEAVLNDGSRLVATQVAASGQELKLTATAYGTVTARKNVVRSLRFTANETKFEEAWQKILDRDSKKDLIVVRKDDKLDFLAGVAGGIDDQFVKFLVDGEEVPVKRERVYGLIFPTAAALGKPQAIIDLQGGVVLQAKQILGKEQGYQVVLASGVSLSVPVTQVRTIDFSLGKVRQLSQMKPSEIQYVPFWDQIWEYRKDIGPGASPITLGGQPFEKGISIHSKTKLTYKLLGEYRRFQATMGIDDMADDSGTLGDVKVTILGDGKPLFEGEVKGPDAPRKIDLDVAGVKDFQILVDYGGDLDIADWLSLGDAKVIK